MSKLATITTGLTKMAGKSGLALQKASPEILLGFGIVGTVTATVMACRATLKVEEVFDTHQQKTEKIKTVWEAVQKGDIPADNYTENDRRKDLVVTYTQTAVDFAKLYGPPIILGTLSIGCIIYGHNILRKRNFALVAAYKAIDEAFKSYRKRVVEEHGAEADYMYRHGLRSEVITETKLDDDGKPKKVKRTQLATDPNGLSMYARYFDDSCSEWRKNSEYNLFFLKSQQNYWNDMLKVRGHVFLNEVYDALGIQRTQAGSVVGWVIGENGDNYIDFGVFDGDKPKSRDFVNGYEKAILLDFNVDGVIYDLFTRAKV